MIRAALHQLRAARGGETAIEFALVGGLLVLLLLASIELGLMIWTGSSLQTVAAATARCAAIGSCSPDPADYAVALAQRWISAGAISANDVQVQATSSCNKASGQFEQVSIASSIWAGALISPLSGATQVATACFPR